MLMPAGPRAFLAAYAVGRGAGRVGFVGLRVGPCGTVGVMWEPFYPAISNRATISSRAPIQYIYFLERVGLHT